MEIWKSVKGYNGFYEVSDLGRVKSISRVVKHSKGGFKKVKEKILKQTKSSNGYLNVSLYDGKKRYTVFTHRLVAEYFLNHINGSYLLVVNHINFDKNDNRLCNLEVVSQRENANRKHLKSTSKYVGVSFYKSKNKWVSSIVINGKGVFIGYFEKELDAHKAYQKKLKQIQSYGNSN